MKKYIYGIIWILFIQLSMITCKEEEAELGTPPAEQDAIFTFAPSAASPNVIKLSNTAPGFLKVWDFGNGSKGEGNEVEAAYPNKGFYDVTLTVFNSGGSVSSTQTIEIKQTDLSLLNPIAVILSGGDAGRTWIIDKGTKGHLGLGPLNDTTAYWWQAEINDKAETGLYDDQFTFKLDGFSFTQQTNGNIYLNTEQASKFPGATPNKGDFSAEYTAPTNLTWTVTSDDAGHNFLTLTNGGFIGYYTGVSKYQIVKINENVMYLRFADAAITDRVWYHRLIAEGFTPPPPPPPPPVLTTALPVNFEGDKPPFNGFGSTTASTFDVVANPDQGGANVSDKVAKYVKGTANWAGIETTLNGKIDFSEKRTFKYKVYSPVTGRALFKIETSDNSAAAIEVFADITKTNEWEVLSFDFPTAATDTYNKIALFLDFDNDNGGTFYLDDIRQFATGCDELETETVDTSIGLNFTMASESFGAFGNIASDVVENPSKTGINISCSVNSYIKNGGCEVWSGVGYLLKDPINFTTTTKKKFKLKVFAVDQVTNVVLRLEKLPHPDVEPSAESTAAITSTGVWQELTFDFSTVTDPDTFKNLIIYFERGSACDGDKYYFDDLVQVE